MARKILLADDSVTAQNMGRKILADAGYEVITVNNGSAALKKIGELKPDLIVLDVYMPGYSGLEVCQRIKEVGETSRIPVLLTVGKLEPFKPDEAKRVRADGFIVKPFEASELLSALSKLEDKIVPRAEASKPSRFARATAALEENRYDKTVAIEEDSGWKNRIAFPSKSKKTEKADQEEVDDAALYNPVNKDLRTIVEHKPAPDTPRATKTGVERAEESRVDLGALTAAGLPKDVTAEEIAALAAAVAQVQGKIANEKVTEPAATDPVEDAAKKPEIRHESQPEAEPVPEVPVTAATLADQNLQEQIAAQEPDPVVTASPADVMAAIAGLEPEAGNTEGASSGNGSWEHGAGKPLADEPVTMALAALGDSCAPSSRWTAVSVALGPEDTAISLEHEMQKAYAAFAGAEAGHAASGSASLQSGPDSSCTTGSSSQGEMQISESALPVPATVAPESIQTLSAVASAATDAVRAAVQELEVVAASYLDQKSSSDLASAGPTEPSTESVSEQRIPTEPELNSVGIPAASAEEAIQTAVAPQSGYEDRSGEPSKEPLVNAPVAGVGETATDQDSVSQASADMRAAALGEPTEKHKEDTEKEPELTATTAAAWASWRRTRESGDPAEPASSESSQSIPQDSAAMAVAVGAESSPENVSAASEDSGEIASIVDSVLADLRPRIVEEISRKLGKKK